MAKKKIFIIFLRSSAVYERRKKSELATWHQRHPVGSLFGSGVYVCAERRVRAQRVPASAKREHTTHRRTHFSLYALAHIHTHASIRRNRRAVEGRTFEKETRACAHTRTRRHDRSERAHTVAHVFSSTHAHKRTSAMFRLCRRRRSPVSPFSPLADWWFLFYTVAKSSFGCSGLVAAFRRADGWRQYGNVAKFRVRLYERGGAPIVEYGGLILALARRSSPHRRDPRRCV